MNVWDRQEGEPANWYARFEAFRQMGPQRTLLSCQMIEYKQRRKTPPKGITGSWREASATWKWRERAIAWDEYQRSLARKEEEEVLRERRKAHIAMALSLQELGVKGIKHQDPKVFTVRDVVRLVESGVKQELLARGAPTDVTEERRRELPAEQLDDDTLAKIAQEGMPEPTSQETDPDSSQDGEDASDSHPGPGNGIPG